MVSFVEAQNSLKRMSERGASLSFKTRQSHAIRFSSKPMVMKVTGLKTYRGPKRKEEFGVCCVPGFYRQKPPFANRWNSDICFSPRIWCGLACGDFKPELVSMMKSENASADIDNEPGKPATSATTRRWRRASSRRSPTA